MYPAPPTTNTFFESITESTVKLPQNYVKESVGVALGEYGKFYGLLGIRGDFRHENFKFDSLGSSNGLDSFGGLDLPLPLARGRPQRKAQSQI